MLKNIGYFIMSLLYPIPNRIEKVSPREQTNLTINDKSYKIYNVSSARIYTDTIHTFGLIKNQALLDGPSFQIINDNFSNVKNNNILRIGTPRIKKILKGTILVLLTGGAGNNNYSHWLLDVLPRIKLAENIIDIKKINYFLFPSLNNKYQIETIRLLKIPRKKLLSSIESRHISSDRIIATTHPRIFTKNSTKDNENNPIWISKWLKNKFISRKSNKFFPNKIYIDRKVDHSSLLGRSITNNDDVKQLLKKSGFISLFLEDYSFSEQVNIFNRAKVIVGLHGAGFANIVFCRKGTHIIEILSKTTGNEFRSLAISNKLIYHSLFGIPKSKTLRQQGHIEVSLNLLKKRISIYN